LRLIREQELDAHRLLSLTALTEAQGRDLAAAAGGTSLLIVILGEKVIHI
jgi:hypothetical protein